MLRELNAPQLRALLKTVEERLGNSPSKAEVIRTLADDGQCSYSTTSAPATLLKCLKENNVPLTPRFAELMGESLPLASLPTEAVDPDKPSVVNVRMLNLKSVSSIEVGKREATVCFIDGETATLGSFDESEFRSSCNLIAFNG